MNNGNSSLVSGTLVAGDVGKPITINAGGYSLANATCTLWISPGDLGRSPAVQLSPLTVSEDGLSATYITTGTDFPSGGRWNVQLEVINPPADPWKSPPGWFYVAPSL